MRWLHHHRRECVARLIVGFLLNVALWFVYQELVRWSTSERELRMLLLGGCLAAVTLVLVAPVFWQGAPWQAPIAFLLIFFLPGFVAFSIITTVLKYW